MGHFSLRDHFTWMIIAGLVMATNGVIQSVGGTQPLGAVSLAVGLLLIGLGFVRPRVMTRGRTQAPAASTQVPAGRRARYARPVGLVLIVSALVIAVLSGLPSYFRNDLMIPDAVIVLMWAALTIGIALLAFDWQRREPSGRWPVALVLGVILGLLAVSAATTSVVRSTAITAWKTSHPVQQVLVFGVNHGGEQPPAEALLAEVQGALTNILEAHGEFHTPRRVGAENYAVLLANPDALGAADLPGVLQSGYLGFHLVHPDTDILASEAAGGGPIPDGFRLIPADAGPLLIASEPFLTSYNIEDQKLATDAGGNPTVSVRFDDAGSSRLGDVTTENVGRRLAIVTRDRALLAPVVREPIHGGTVQIAGNFSEDEAFALVRALYLGGLPVPLVLISQSVVDESSSNP